MSVERCIDQTKSVFAGETSEPNLPESGEPKEIVKSAVEYLIIKAEKEGDNEKAEALKRALERYTIRREEVPRTKFPQGEK